MDFTILKREIGNRIHNYRLKEGIHEIDKDAFFIITDAYEVFGGE